MIELHEDEIAQQLAATGHALAQIDQALDVAATAAGPIEQRMLVAAGEISTNLVYALASLARVYYRAAASRPHGPVRAELEANTRECRSLGILASLSHQVADLLGLSLNEAALHVAGQFEDGGSDPEFTTGSREELANGARRARALADHFAAATADGR